MLEDIYIHTHKHLNGYTNVIEKTLVNNHEMQSNNAFKIPKEVYMYSCAIRSEAYKIKSWSSFKIKAASIGIGMIGGQCIPYVCKKIETMCFGPMGMTIQTSQKFMIVCEQLQIMRIIISRFILE